MHNKKVTDAILQRTQKEDITHMQSTILQRVILFPNVSVLQVGQIELPCYVNRQSMMDINMTPLLSKMYYQKSII